MTMPTKGSESPHGTAARYGQHLRDGEEACTPCKKANAEKQAKYREDNPDAAGKKSWYTKTYYRAVRMVANNHPDELESTLRKVRESDPWTGE
jgi:hypothetical protein